MSIFTEHPKEVNETYFQHLSYACSKGFAVSKIALILFVHGVFPFWYKYEGSQRIEDLCDELVKRKSGAQNEEHCSCSDHPK